ncbi:hypothetical protein CSUB01_11116 [Colletotrichum sublineola]|uniref:Uncharacterized protein n=1 Tax=Colletotrichum sublineola TaxID=1173701 RepID=A0A066Y218_COLSU|nr:hypothetical protein CSUB01_11116 [Colletotrichum sublineola]
MQVPESLSWRSSIVSNHPKYHKRRRCTPGVLLLRPLDSVLFRDVAPSSQARADEGCQVLDDGLTPHIGHPVPSGGDFASKEQNEAILLRPRIGMSQLMHISPTSEKNLPTRPESRHHSVE